MSSSCLSHLSTLFGRGEVIASREESCVVFPFWFLPCWTRWFEGKAGGHSEVLSGLGKVKTRSVQVPGTARLSWALWERDMTLENKIQTHLELYLAELSQWSSERLKLLKYVWYWREVIVDQVSKSFSSCHQRLLRLLQEGDLRTRVHPPAEGKLLSFLF